MRKIFVAAAAGIMAMGLAAVPAQAATGARETTTATTKNFTIWSPLKEGYLKGKLYARYGHMYFTGVVVDTTDGPRDYTFAEVRYVDRNNHPNLKRSRNITSAEYRFKPILWQENFEARVCEGNPSEDECGPWVNLF
ncbi:hypothetical protein [Nonomuraea lactucae]|uniref:hypothetical protein n=1 Tax=Nonomuraea lactucae TaxID=2249762 RepID=UPI000DE569EE|nr:hypothetical protein [Nonomuraea lactucae]